MPIHIPSKYHHFILRDTTYQMKYLIPKTLLLLIIITVNGVCNKLQNQPRALPHEHSEKFTVKMSQSTLQTTA